MLVTYKEQTEKHHSLVPFFLSSWLPFLLLWPKQFRRRRTLKSVLPHFACRLIFVFVLIVASSCPFSRRSLDFVQIFFLSFHPPPFPPSTCWIRDGQLCVIFCGRIRRRREMPPLNATKINIKNRNARSNGKVYEWERPKAKTRNCFCSLGLYYKRPPPFMQLVSLLDALFLSFFPSFSPLERRYTAHTFPTKKDDFGLLVCSFFFFLNVYARIFRLFGSQHLAAAAVVVALVMSRNRASLRAESSFKGAV